MKLNTVILSECEQERIHLQSLRILAEVGVCYHGQKALKILSAHGARVDWDRQVACLPGELVDQALQTAPKSFTLAARDPVYDLPLPSPKSGYCMDGTAAFAQDFETGERRYGTSKDIENSMRVFQQLDLGVMAWASTCASDAPAHARALHEFFGMLRHCSKHGQHELHSVAQVPYLIAGLQAIMGSEAAIRARKECSLIYCPIAPLSHDGQMLDAYLELGEWDLPVMSMPMPVTATTGPAGLFANISLANAEMLSSLVIFQLAHPGRPVIYSSAVGSLDFTTGAFLGGTPEMGLQSAALTVMGRYYGLPSTSAGCTSDAKEPGAQAVLEKLITTIPPVLARADIIVGIGEIESDQLLVLEQMIVDNEIGHFCQRLLEGVDSSEGRDLFADIAQVGPGGHFLKTRSARQAPRSGEFYMSQLLDRHAYEAWIELGRPSMYGKAREKVRQILEEPPVGGLPEAINAELDVILRTADRELPGVEA